MVLKCVLFSNLAGDFFVSYLKFSRRQAQLSPPLLLGQFEGVPRGNHFDMC